MRPGIGRSIGTGFRTANRSWAGMGVVAGGWIVLMLLLVLIGVLGVAITRPPLRLFQGQQETAQPRADAVPQAESTTPAAQSAPGSDQAQTLFTQLETAEQAPSQTPSSQPEGGALTAEPAAGAAALSPTTPDQARADREMAEWLGRHWPVLLVLAVALLSLLVAGSTWLNGGQVGYVAQRVMTGRATIAEFFAAGTRAFWPLLGSSGLGLLGGLVVALVGGGLVWVVSVLPAPEWGKVLLGVLFGLVGLVGVLWLAVRLLFWPIGIVMDRLGPIGGIRASLKASRGHGWRVLGFLLLWLLIGLGVWLPFGILEEVLKRVEEPGGGIVAVTLGMTLVRWVVDLYIGFAFLGACVRWYEDAKAPVPATA